ncbi:MAG: hypothetical protein LV473_10645 [Nitrospira sp.]|nr:hypothetical protein [Nitrospira sp.]
MIRDSRMPRETSLFERYDGADIAHLLHVRSEKLDWGWLLWRFDRQWRVLLSHLVLFGFVYPCKFPIG